MRILLTGASGFIGSHLCTALLAAGHTLTLATRDAQRHQPGPRLRYIAADFTRDVSMPVWQSRLENIDVVINAVGILREQGTQTFELLHVQAPCALFLACELVSVRLVLQVSALGADQDASSAYHLSKKKAAAGG